MLGALAHSRAPIVRSGGRGRPRAPVRAHPCGGTGRSPLLARFFARCPGDLWRFVSLDTAVVLGRRRCRAHRTCGTTMCPRDQENAQLNNLFALNQICVCRDVGVRSCLWGRTNVGHPTSLSLAPTWSFAVVAQVWVRRSSSPCSANVLTAATTGRFVRPCRRRVGGSGRATPYYGWKAAIPAYRRRAYRGGAHTTTSTT
jgi:hypothetical protein